MIVRGSSSFTVASPGVIELPITVDNVLKSGQVFEFLDGFFHLDTNGNDDKYSSVSLIATNKVLVSGSFGASPTALAIANSSVVVGGFMGGSYTRAASSQSVDKQAPLRNMDGSGYLIPDFTITLLIEASGVVSGRIGWFFDMREVKKGLSQVTAIQQSLL